MSDTVPYNAMIASVPMPARVQRMPVSPKGFPVPWFVCWFNGVPDFRVVDPYKIVEAIRRDLCWICGGKLGVYKCFNVGPMCIVNRTSGEPPSHIDCAEYAAKACPFLTKPKMKRNDKDFPAPKTKGPGIMLERNPGACAVLVTKSYKPFRVGDGLLIEMGSPEEVLWFAEGRTATRDEVMASIESGLPILRAEAEKDGQQSIDLLERMHKEALKYVPKE